MLKKIGEIKKLFFVYPIILFSVFLFSKVFASGTLPNNKTMPSFSPYADITVGAVWTDWQNYPAGRPADLTPIA